MDIESTTQTRQDEYEQQIDEQYRNVNENEPANGDLKPGPYMYPNTAPYRRATVTKTKD